MDATELAGEIFRTTGILIIVTNVRYAPGDVMSDAVENVEGTVLLQPLHVVREASRAERERQSRLVAKLLGLPDAQPINERMFAYVVETD